jgi:hypothetical protein
LVAGSQRCICAAICHTVPHYGHIRLSYGLNHVVCRSCPDCLCALRFVGTDCFVMLGECCIHKTTLRLT